MLFNSNYTGPHGPPMMFHESRHAATEYYGQYRYATVPACDGPYSEMENPVVKHRYEIFRSAFDTAVHKPASPSATQRLPPGIESSYFNTTPEYPMASPMTTFSYGSADHQPSHSDNFIPYTSHPTNHPILSPPVESQCSTITSAAAVAHRSSSFYAQTPPWTGNEPPFQSHHDYYSVS